MGSVVKVVILAGTVDEARSLAKLAGLAMADVTIARSVYGVDGLRLTSDDLILEFPSWQDVPESRRKGIERNLQRSSKKSKQPVPWERIGR
jgi:hypothetical protein